MLQGPFRRIHRSQRDWPSVITHLTRLLWQKSHADRSLQPSAPDCSVHVVCNFEGRVEDSPSLKSTVDAKTMVDVEASKTLARSVPVNG